MRILDPELWELYDLLKAFLREHKGQGRIVAPINFTQASAKKYLKAMDRTGKRLAIAETRRKDN